MRIVSWNVAGLRGQMRKGGLEWLKESNIDDINLKSWLNEAKNLAEANSNFNKFKIKLLDLME